MLVGDFLRLFQEWYIWRDTAELESRNVFQSLINYGVFSHWLTSKRLYLSSPDPCNIWIFQYIHISNLTLDIERLSLTFVSFSRIAQLCLTLCNPVDCSTPGFPVHHQLPELTQTHVHWVGDAIQSSHPLSSPSPPVFNLSQHQDLFLWVTSLHQVARDWSFSFSISSSNEYSGLISFTMDRYDLLAVQGDPEESSPTPRFKSINSLVLSFLYGSTLTSIHDY